MSENRGSEFKQKVLNTVLGVGVMIGAAGILWAVYLALIQVGKWMIANGYADPKAHLYPLTGIDYIIVAMMNTLLVIVGLIFLYKFLEVAGRLGEWIREVGHGD